MKRLRKITAVALAAIMALILAACNINVNDGTGTYKDVDELLSGIDEAMKAQQDEVDSKEENTPEAEEAVEKNGDVIILYTSDVHCGIDMGFGYAGLKQVRDTYEAKGYTTILVDDGDAIQGGAIGTLTKGSAIIDLMNEVKYDVAIPGNHEFDYGMDNFLELTKKADYPYISCNFTYDGDLVFDPYVIKEAAGMKIAFVGVTTPETLVTSTPKYFEDSEGNLVYGFMQDKTGEGVYNAVQKAVDDARAEGAEYVYVMGHMGNDLISAPWTYADVIANTNGIDVFLDGHSHDTEQVVMKNKDGEDVVRSAVGTKLNSIGYSHISAQDGITETDILSWPAKVSAVESLGIDNEVKRAVDAANSELDEELSKVIGHTDMDLTIFDPVATDAENNPIRMVRRAETNLADLCTDAMRLTLDTDIAFLNGGGFRTGIGKGDITYKNIIDVFPFNNQVCIVEASGQQILDALEWGARAVPEELGGFPQVSGMSYEIDVNVPSGCVADENSMLKEIKGDRRVKNVMIGDEPIDPNKKYTVAGADYILLNHGDGYTSFDGATLVADQVMVDNQVIIDYLVNVLNGNVGDEYSDPTGQGRITITE